MVWISYWLVVLVSGAGLVELVLRGLQLAHAARRRSPQAIAKCAFAAPNAPLLSVHLATYNEPPKLVIETLKALAASDYSRFEVIVIDNNTRDPDLWRPVAAAAVELGARFRFAHFDRLAGAKAGALNVALGMTDPRAKYIAVVDADYQVDPHFLSHAVSAAETSRADYVQFPQAYRGVGRYARGVEHELGDYFASFAGRAGRPGPMLPTGTLSVFKRSALVAVGGWPTSTITEDAEIGLRLQAAGFKGLWLSEPRGRGLLPVSFSGIRQQRARWAAGNLQVLRRLGSLPRVRLKDLLSLTAQLTAWVSLILPAALSLFILALAPDLPNAHLITLVAAFVVLSSALLTAARLLLLSDARASVATRLGALATKMALTWTSASAWLPALSGRPMRFHRTPKAIESREGYALKPELVISSGFLILSAVYALRHLGLEAGACGLLASAWPCAIYVDHSLRRAAASNDELA